MKKNDVNDLSFEEAMEKLDECIAVLEGDCTLDESMKKFEEAVNLVKICNEKLSSARGRVRILTEGLEGEISDSPFCELNNED